MTSTSRAEISKAPHARGMIKKSWAAIKSKLKHACRVKQPVQVISYTQKQVEIDPSPKEPVQEIVPSVKLSTSEADHTRTPSVHTEPLRNSLSSLPGFQKLKGALLASPALDESHPVTLPSHIPETNGHSETIPQRQGSNSNDSVGSDEAVFGDTPNASSRAVIIAPNRPRGSPIETPHVQKPPIRIVVGEVEAAKPATPGPVPLFIPRPEDTPLRCPGLLSPPWTPSRQLKPLDPQNAQQKSPVTPTNLLHFPSPFMVIPNLGTPTAPSSPVMPPTPIKHQGRIPEAIGEALNVAAYRTPATPAIPLRSPKRPPPPGIVPVPNASGENNNFGVVGDRRVVKDQPGSKEKAPSAKEESMPKRDGAHGMRDQENRDDTKSQQSVSRPGAVYVGDMKYYVGRYLGGGGMGKVYSVVNKESMNLAALKVIRRKRLNLDTLALVKGEWAVLKAISEAKFFRSRMPHGIQFVHHLLESWYDQENIYFAMPLCVYSLRGHLRTFELDSSTTKVYAAELINGLEALHDMRVIHCDLKPDNILVYPDGHLSISDFGLAVSWLDPRYNDYPSQAFRGRGLGGTYGYMAPEIISAFQNPDGPRRGNYGFAADIWSMGIIVAELGMQGRHFVSYEDEEEKERWKGDFESFACDVVLSREMLTKRIEKYLWGDHAMLVERMIEIDEASRPSFDEIFSHPFFSDLDLGKVSQKEYQVPNPPFEGVLPCWHTYAIEHWFSKYSQVNDGGEPLPERDPEYDEMRAVCLSSDMDRWVMPKDFVWDLSRAERLAARRARHAAPQAQGSPNGRETAE